jgi:hypothetical protein
LFQKSVLYQGMTSKLALRAAEWVPKWAAKKAGFSP